MLRQVTLRFILLFMIGLLAPSASAQLADIGISDSPALKSLDDIPSNEVDSYLATLSDAQARELLLIEANKYSEHAEPSMMNSSYISYAIMSLNDRSELFETEFEKINYARQHYGENLNRVLQAMFFTKGMSAIPKVSTTLIMLLVVGGLIINVAFKSLGNFREKLRERGQYTSYFLLGRSLTGLALDLSKVGLFVLITVPLTFLFFDKLDPVRVLASSVLILVAAIWAIRNILKELLFSPVNGELNAKDDRCRTIYYWSIMGFFVPSVLALLLKGLLEILHFPTELLRLNSMVLATISVSALIIGVLLLAREKGKQTAEEGEILYKALSHNKQWLIVLILLGFYIIAFKNIVIGETVEMGTTNTAVYNYFALLMFIFMPIYLRITQLLLTTESPRIEMGDEEENILEPDIKLNKWTKLIFVIPYIALIFLFTMEGAKIGLLSWFSEGAGASFGQAASSIFVTAMLGIVAWNIVNTFINKYLPNIALDPTALMDSEGGSDEAATRMQTILPIARNFALTTISVIVAFSIFSSLGVNTGPLLAGAGIIGIAIGFGAQKLVQDVVSGIFFLFEDAFRIGEYIDTGTLVGTVESTSVRSLKLRHHLGAVQTIPYGEIRSVRNLSRDFVIMKLKFRVPFDTDIELVRRTIKKVGIKLLDHEELGQDFIAPLKSQGVQTAEDDALVIRMKFTCKPGKQWMIKREAYRLVQEALAAKGIQFASRQVTVHVPDNNRADPEIIKQAAGAAIASDLEKQKEKPFDPLDDL